MKNITLSLRNSVFILFACFLLTALIGCKNKKEENKQKEPTNMEFAETKHDFGEIKKGEVVSHRFKFKNTGTADLYLTKIEASCGCTTAEYSKKPIKPGEEGFVELIFNSSGRFGKQYKEISIFANVPTGKKNLLLIADIKE